MLSWHDMFRAPLGEVDRRVEARLLRQQVLDREPPLELFAVVDESVLYRRLGGVQVMRNQLQHIVATFGRPNIKVQVVPFAGSQLITTGAFTYMQFPQAHDVPLHDIVTVEHLTGSDYVEAAEDTYQYLTAFTALMNKALSPQDSLQLVKDAIDTLDSGDQISGPG